MYRSGTISPVHHFIHPLAVMMPRNVPRLHRAESCDSIPTMTSTRVCQSTTIWRPQVQLL